MMAIENQQRHQLGPMNFDHLPYTASPQFSNPWASTSSPHNGFPSLEYNSLHKTQSTRPTTMSMPYTSLPATAPSLSTASYAGLSYGQNDLLGQSQDLMNSSRPMYDGGYSSASTQPSNAYTSAPAPYAPLASYGQSLAQQQQAQQDNRRMSESSSSQSHNAYVDVLDAGRGLVGMSQDLTPRNIYGPRGDRGSTDSYGFPSTHSSHSSISSASTGFPSFYAGSVDSSVTDYSSTSESVDSVNSRTLPRPSGLNLPPAPQSMMGQFNSKISSSTAKKHKCKICPKRFTRPSSLQTHMYSHTGEKPFACEVQGCGRNFSVVSNLRRHRKVHKGEHGSDHGSPEGSWASSER